MASQRVSVGARLLMALALTGASLPLIQAWRQSDSAPIATPVTSVSAPATAYDADPYWSVPDTLEIQLRPGFNAQTLNDLSKKLGARVAYNSEMGPETGVACVTLPHGTNLAQALETLRADSSVETADVEHIYRTPELRSPVSVDGGSDFDPRLIPDITGNGFEPATTMSRLSVLSPSQKNSKQDEGNRWKPNDPRYGEQWNFQMVKAEEAWEVARGKGVVVAVVDTGVAYGDTKLGKIARDFKQTRFVPGRDTANNTDVPYDDNGHGTHVAGTIAESTDNNEGVAGLAFEATIMPIKVLRGNGSGTTAAIGEGIRWAADHGANIINMSLGGPVADRVMGSACEYAYKKGVTIVCAAGNSGREGVGYPAAFPECIAVSSVGPTAKLSFYSSWGKQVAIAAPGGDSQVGGPAEGKILQNTVLDGKDDYFAFQGTSMASPHVAAVAALIESQGIRDPKDVRAILLKSAQKADGPKEKYGAGILNAAGAAKLAANTYGDSVARFWFVVALFAGCYLIGKIRTKQGESNAYPFWPTAALAFGLVFPDWVTNYLGLSSHFNIVAHSVILPVALLLFGVREKVERRCVGWMAFGLTMHLGWEFLRHTLPAGIDMSLLPSLLWVGTNVLVGLGIWLSGFEE